MKLYDCKVRLGGSVMNEVRKAGITAAEVVVLRLLHGDDAVADIVEVGDVKREGKVERERLYRAYASPDANSEEVVKSRLADIRGALGFDTVPLPTRLDADDPFLVEPKQTIRRARKPSDDEAAAALAG